MKNIKVKWDDYYQILPIYGRITNVPNHQPDDHDMQGTKLSKSSLAGNPSTSAEESTIPMAKICGPGMSMPIPATTVATLATRRKRGVTLAKEGE